MRWRAGRQRGGVGPGGKDALDGPVAGVTGGQRPSAGRIQPTRPVAVAEPQHPLGGTQVVQRVGGAREQLADQPADCLAEFGGLPAAPGRGALQEGDLLGWVVGPVGALAAFGRAHVGLDQLPLTEHLEQLGGQANVDVSADQPPGHRVQPAGDLDVAVGMDLRRRPGRQLERLGRQRQQRRRFRSLEHLQRLRASKRPAGAAAGDLEAPDLSGLLHRGQRAELAAGEEAVADIGNRPLHAWLVLRLPRPRGVDEHAVVAGQLGVGTVELGVVQVRADHAGLEVIGHQPPGRSAEEAQRGHVRLDPYGQRHRHHRADEQVPRAGQHHHKRPHPPGLAGGRVGPQAQVAVVQLGLLAGRWVGLAHRDLPPDGLTVGHGRPDVAAEAGDAGLQAVLVAQPLPDRGDRVDRQLLADQLMERGDLAEPGMAQLGGDQLREPPTHQLRPALLADRLAPGHDAGRHGGRDVLTDGVAVHAQAVGDLADRAARMPVDQDLGDIHHLEGPPCHPDPPRHRCRDEQDRRSGTGRGGEFRDRGPDELADRRGPQAAAFRDRPQLADPKPHRHNNSTIFRSIPTRSAPPPRMCGGQD